MSQKTELLMRFLRAVVAYRTTDYKCNEDTGEELETTDTNTKREKPSREVTRTGGKSA
jgi:hypothetical protein